MKSKKKKMSKENKEAVAAARDDVLVLSRAAAKAAKANEPKEARLYAKAAYDLSDVIYNVKLDWD